MDNPKKNNDGVEKVNDILLDRLGVPKNNLNINNGEQAPKSIMFESPSSGGSVQKNDIESNPDFAGQHHTALKAQNTSAGKGEDYTLGFRNEVKEDVEDLQVLVGKLDEYLDEYFKIIQNTEEYWDGMAADIVRKIVNTENIEKYREKSETAKSVTKTIALAIEKRIQGTNKSADKMEALPDQINSEKTGGPL